MKNRKKLNKTVINACEEYFGKTQEHRDAEETYLFMVIYSADPSKFFQPNFIKELMKMLVNSEKPEFIYNLCKEIEYKIILGHGLNRNDFMEWFNDNIVEPYNFVDPEYSTGLHENSPYRDAEYPIGLMDDLYIDSEWVKDLLLRYPWVMYAYLICMCRLPD